jgi:hypothetical protein
MNHLFKLVNYSYLIILAKINGSYLHFSVINQ